MQKLNCSPLQTKGLSLEQVDILYQNTTPIHSVAFRNKIFANDVHASDAAGIAKITGNDGYTEKHEVHSADEKV